jgi:peroxiredoxin Q/BCP|tara:strand:- start:116 stop:583 length:468 start_codon:yes stop_codon:yes gene_type:complete
MHKIALGKPVPDFKLSSTGNTSFRLSLHHGKNIVIYFYPKDNTPGCTLEAQNFRDHIVEFEAKNTIIVGVSRDSIRVHEGFKSKQNLPFELLSDADESVCTLFDVIKLKKNFGHEYMGIVRSTFLIDNNGILLQEWRNVRVKEHLAEVLEIVKTL